jgi:hypothetical protein
MARKAELISYIVVIECKNLAVSKNLITFARHKETCKK